tara:strand:- start:1003 stop:1443 length:441 start_codon:yes stop_codon:yes gene_type:complete
LARIFCALSVVTELVVGTASTTGIGFTLAILTDLSICTLRAIGDTHTICGTTCGVSTTPLICTWILDTGGLCTDFGVLTRVVVVATCGLAFFIETDSITSAVCVEFADFIASALTILAHFAIGACYAFAGLCLTGINNADTTSFTR